MARRESVITTGVAEVWNKYVKVGEHASVATCASDVLNDRESIAISMLICQLELCATCDVVNDFEVFTWVAEVWNEYGELWGTCLVDHCFAWHMYESLFLPSVGVRCLLYLPLFCSQDTCDICTSFFVHLLFISRDDTLDTYTCLFAFLPFFPQLSLIFRR